MMVSLYINTDYDVKTIIIILTIVIVTTVGLIWHENNIEDSCIDKGGEYHYSRNGSLCLKKDSIIK